MDFAGPTFVIVLVALCTLGWVVNNWIRAKHGFSVSDDWGRNITREAPESARKMELLTSENEQLAGKVIRLEERIAVLERIATDPAARTAREIEELR